MVELVDTPDLNSRVNCFNKSDSDGNIHFDGIIPHTVNNPVGSNTRVGSTPTGATKMRGIIFSSFFIHIYTYGFVFFNFNNYLYKKLIYGKLHR